MADCSDTLPSRGLEPSEIPSSGEQGCLSNDELLAFARGDLERARRDSAHAHMDHCSVCQHLLSEAVHALELEPGQEQDTAGYNTTFRPRALVGHRYRIVRFIARGGMGEVYEAYDDDLRERVALKTVAPTASDDPRAVRRLKAEVQLARRVSHPNVCRIYDLGSHVLEPSEASVHFLTMEFVDGEPLGQRLRTGGALPLAEALSYARQLLAGLSTAHRAGTLHRDLKSDNVILRTGSDGTVSPVILDFGLARSLDPSARGLTSGTNQAFVGTLSYMAPEQIEGKQLSAASDLYAFGVLWFEMLTGTLPFGAESAAANALERLHKRPATPSSVNRSLPKALDAIVLGCLARHPDNRFRSADEVLEALEAWERSPSPSRGSARRMIALGLASTLVAGIVGWALLTDGSRRAVPEPRRSQSLAPVVPPTAAKTEGAPADPTQQPLESESQPAASAAPAARSRVVEAAPPGRDRELPGRAAPSAVSPPISEPDTASLPEIAQTLIDETTARQDGEEQGRLGFAEPPSAPAPSPPVVEPPSVPAPAPPSPKRASHRWENPFDAVVEPAQSEQ